jgi:WD40-like Beta Propeller Repeat
VSSNRFGTGSGNGHSGSPVIGNDGRFVLFSSDATDLVSLPSTTVGQLFLRDLSTGITTMVSVDRTGTQGANGVSGSPAISTNGRFVAFASNATDLVATPAVNAGGNIFVRDLQTGTTTLVSINVMGTSSGNNGSFDHAMSADGRFIVFSSFATDLTTTATNGRVNVFVRDQQMGITTLASVNQTGTAGGNGNSGNDAPAGISSHIGGAEIILFLNWQHGTVTDLCLERICLFDGLFWFPTRPARRSPCCASVRKDVGPNFNSGVQNRNFTANWICRDVPTIEVICPALARFPV